MERDVIDRDGRRTLAELLRHLVAGQVTNDEFEDRAPRRSGDFAIAEIRLQAWYLYDDLREYRLTGKDRMSPEVRAHVARWIMFLRTDLEYGWPVEPRLLETLRAVGSVATFGLLGRLRARRYRLAGELDVWPFLSADEFENAKRSPRYMGGAVQQRDEADER